jgi:hypothetical protein
MDQSTKHVIELCQRVLTNPARKEKPHWGDDFIAHQVEAHPEIRDEVARLGAGPSRDRPH